MVSGFLSGPGYCSCAIEASRPRKKGTEADCQLRTLRYGDAVRRGELLWEFEIKLGGPPQLGSVTIPTLAAYRPMDPSWGLGCAARMGHGEAACTLDWLHANQLR